MFPNCMVGWGEGARLVGVCRQRDPVPHGGTYLYSEPVGLRGLQGGIAQLSVNRNTEGLRERMRTCKKARGLTGRDSLPCSCNREMVRHQLLLGLTKDKRLWGALGGTAAHRPLPPPPPPPWPPASGAPDIMRNSTTGMMYIQYLAKNDFCS